MAKSVSPDNRKRIWAFGKSCDFHIVSTDIRNKKTNQVLSQEDYRHSKGMTPDLRQKSQIVLHCTASNNAAESVIKNTWSNTSVTASAHFILERTHSKLAARPALPQGVPPPDATDGSLVDAVRVMDDETVTYHGESVNSCSIGIEIANAANTWKFTTNKHEPSMGGGQKLPLDLNRYISAAPARGSNVLRGDYLALQEEQYAELILLLRHLCITHRIPRIFLGLTTEEMYKSFFWRHTDSEAQRRIYKERIFHFRGILHHRNINNPKDKPRKDKNGKWILDSKTKKPKLFPSSPKACPGILHRNRLFRGIIDNWWMPVDIDGTLRNYYSGPISPHPWDPKKPKEATKNAYFRPGDDRKSLTGTVFKTVDIEAISEAKHYFDRNQLDLYYAITESRQGGCFPVGSNLMWHGGVHLPVADANPWVYAAASGTIVAARCNASDTPTDDVFGSQRFILIRHAVYPYTEPDPDGVGQRINYTEPPQRDGNGNPTNPVYVFSLYMHMAPIANPDGEDDLNPPWFNLWRRNNGDEKIDLNGDRGVVFAPDIEVSVGDILGCGGIFRGSRKIHFEIIGHQENELLITRDNPFTVSAKDTDDNAVCNSDTIKSLIKDLAGDSIDRGDIFRAAPDMRNVKVLHLSEWALSKESQIKVLVPNEDKRKKFWPHLYRFSWVEEAMSANSALRKQLGEKGIFWHYHPITFMNYMNQLIEGECAERREEEFTVPGSTPQTNVEIDDENFFGRFISWNGTTKTFEQRTSNGSVLKPNDISSSSFGYSFKDNDIACRKCGANTHQQTHLSIGLLEIIERIQGHYNKKLAVSCSYLCSKHLADTSLCTLNGSNEMKEHNQGVAIDICPAGSPSQNDCVSLWTSAKTVIDSLMANLEADNLSGDILQTGFPAGFGGVTYRTRPSIEAKLNATPPGNLDAGELKSFAVHVSLAGAAAAGSAAGSNSDTIWVGIVSIKVINDEDWFGKGEWELDAKLNGVPCEKIKVKVSSGTVLQTPSTWRREVNIKDETLQAITVEISGEEIDLIWNDDLGTANARFGRTDTPAWGEGTHHLSSSKGSYEATVVIGPRESVDVGANGDDIVPEDDSGIQIKIPDSLPGKKSFGF